MNWMFIGFLLAVVFGLFSTYYFLKASSIYFSYKESVRRITKGEVDLTNYLFLFPLKLKEEYETEGLAAKREDHRKYISKYWTMVMLMLALVALSTSIGAAS